MAEKILVIEDDIFLGDVLLQKLKNEGYDASLARDGKEGFGKIAPWKPDLILLDIMLPSMNGYEILEAKKKDSSIEHIPVIIISNSGQPVEINRALALGVKDYLVKAQFDPEEVMVKVRRQLSHDANGAPADRSVELSGRKIMWVEDDAFLSDIIARKLSAIGCNLVHAGDGETAVTMIENEMPDIILLDIVLPGMSGFEVLQKTKSSEKTKGIPVILLSNLGQKSDTDKGAALGAARFLIKATVTLDEIIDEIKDVLSEKK